MSHKVLWTPGQQVLLTGASGGIGKEMAKLLVQRGCDLILVARKQAALDDLVQELSAINDQPQLHTLSVDLAKKEAADQIYHHTQEQGLTVDVLLNNAGVGMHRAVCDYDLEQLYHMLILNNFTLTALCRHYARDMKSRRAGAILNVASLAAYQPVPYLSAYAASKSYVLSFSEALSMELEEHGVTVTCFSPGHTDTGFFSKANISDSHAFYGPKTRCAPSVVAEQALSALSQGKLSAIGGVANSLLGNVNRLCPRWMTAKISKYLVTQGQ